ncbi:TetR family transcriptional regulator [Streptomyces sp. SAJ15]|nr:TetR family transcriptional regulator [Streptomyces sp. SAJ15]
MGGAGVTAGSGRPTGGRPARLELETIVDTARRILETEGVEALSMRRLAKEVGSTPMALYRHVRDKDELLARVLSGTAAALPRPELPQDPRERLLAVCLHMHDLLKAQPWVVQVLSLGDLTDQGALWMTEEIIDTSMACGLSERDALHAYRTIWHYVLGTLIYQAAVARRAEDPERHRAYLDMLAGVDPAEMPRMAALGGRWEELAASYDVASGLRAVIGGLLAQGGALAPGADTPR